MAVVKVYDQVCVEAGEINLAPEVFEVPVRPEILHSVVRAQLAARRAGTHATKTRSQVSGGGSKPWKQKGTGRARAGSNRSPIWRGGAVIFGPQPHSYGFKINKKICKLALKMALSAKVLNESVVVVKNIEFPEIKTKRFVEFIEGFGLSKALIVGVESMPSLELSMRNVSGVKFFTVEKLNVYDVLKYKHLVVLEKAVEPIHARLK